MSIIIRSGFYPIAEVSSFEEAIGRTKRSVFYEVKVFVLRCSGIVPAGGTMTAVLQNWKLKRLYPNVNVYAWRPGASIYPNVNVKALSPAPSTCISRVCFP